MSGQRWRGWGLLLSLVAVVMAVLILRGHETMEALRDHWFRGKARSELRQIAILRIANSQGGQPVAPELILREWRTRHGHERDPWGEPYAFAESAVGLVWSSRGPDREDGTSDDILVPERLLAQELGERSLEPLPEETTAGRRAE